MGRRRGAEGRDWPRLAATDRPPLRRFNTFLWFEFYLEPNEHEKELLHTILESWFVLGRLGGYNQVRGPHPRLPPSLQRR